MAALDSDNMINPTPNLNPRGRGDMSLLTGKTTYNTVGQPGSIAVAPAPDPPTNSTAPLRTQPHSGVPASGASVHTTTTTSTAASHTLGESTILAGVVVYVSPDLAGSTEALHALTLRLGGSVRWALEPAVTHVVHAVDTSRDGRNILRQARASELFVVSPVWLEECDRRGQRLDELVFPHDRSRSEILSMLHSSTKSGGGGGGGGGGQKGLLDSRIAVEPVATTTTTTATAAAGSDDTHGNKHATRGSESGGKNARGSNSSVREPSPSPPRRNTKKSKLSRRRGQQQQQQAQGQGQGENAGSGANDRGDTSRDSEGSSGKKRKRASSSRKSASKDKSRRKSSMEGPAVVRRKLNLDDSQSQSTVDPELDAAFNSFVQKSMSSKASASRPSPVPGVTAPLSAFQPLQPLARHLSLDELQSESSEKSKMPLKDHDWDNSQVVTYDRGKVEERLKRASSAASNTAGSVSANESAGDAGGGLGRDASLSSGGVRGGGGSGGDKEYEDEISWLCRAVAQSDTTVAAPVVSVKRVLLTAVKPAEKEYFTKVIERLNGVALQATGYVSEVTHLIVGKIAKSEKYLACVAAGVWVLRTSFIVDSEKMGYWVSEEEHEYSENLGISRLSANEIQMHNAPRRWRLLREQFPGYGPFYEWRSVLIVDGRKQKGFTRLLEAGGATLVACEPVSSEILNEVTHVFIETGFMSDERHSNFVYRCISAGVPLLPPDYIADYLVLQERPKYDSYIHPDQRVSLGNVVPEYPPPEAFAKSPARSKAKSSRRSRR